MSKYFDTLQVSIWKQVLRKEQSPKEVSVWLCINFPETWNILGWDLSKCWLTSLLQTI